MSKVAPIPIENLSFPAYRLPGDEGEYSPPAAFISLAQWFEAEKFRPFHRDLYDQVMLGADDQGGPQVCQATPGLLAG
jgi:hypothetical protein